jgi:hypothetical protein
LSYELGLLIANQRYTASWSKANTRRFLSSPIVEAVKGAAFYAGVQDFMEFCQSVCRLYRS